MTGDHGLHRRSQSWPVRKAPATWRCRDNCHLLLLCKEAWVLVCAQQVHDLHAVTPASFLEVSGAILHGLSLQQARNNSAACGQVRLPGQHASLPRLSMPGPACLPASASCQLPTIQ